MDNLEEISFFTPFLSKTSDIKVMDIGCGDGTLLSNIYNSMSAKISKLIGVDKNEDEQHELDIDEFIQKHNCLEENVQLTIDQIELVEDDAFIFLNTVETHQDLIIFSNFIHLFPWDKTKEIIQLALAKLSNEGIIYIKVRNKKHPFKTTEQRHPVDLAIIEEIKLFAKIIIFEENGMHYNLIIKK